MLLRFGELYKLTGDKVMYLKKDRNGYYYRVQNDEKADLKRSLMFLFGLFCFGCVFGFMYLMFNNL